MRGCAVRRQGLDVLLDMTKHVRVEPAGQAAVRDHGDDQHVFNFFMLLQKRVFRAARTLGDIRQHLGHRVGVRRGRDDALAGATNLGRRHHFHGARDLLRRIDGVDAPFYVV